MSDLKIVGNSDIATCQPISATFAVVRTCWLGILSPDGAGRPFRKRGGGGRVFIIQTRKTQMRLKELGNFAGVMAMLALFAWWLDTSILPDIEKEMGNNASWLMPLCLFGPYLIFTTLWIFGGLDEQFSTRNTTNAQFVIKRICYSLVIHVACLLLSIFLLGPLFASILMMLFGPGSPADCGPGLPSRYC